MTHLCVSCFDFLIEGFRNEPLLGAITWDQSCKRLKLISQIEIRKIFLQGEALSGDSIEKFGEELKVQDLEVAEKLPVIQSVVKVMHYKNFRSRLSKWFLAGNRSIVFL